MTILFRLIHILTGVLWVGGVGVVMMFLLPAIVATGPIGGQFMQHLVKNTKFAAYLPVLGVLTVLSGFYLFWHDMSISNGTFASSRPGMTYSIGGATALLALVVGIVMSGRSAGELSKIGAAVGAAGGPPTAEQSQRIEVLKGRMKTGTRIAFLLLLVAVAAMAVARYL